MDLNTRKMWSNGIKTAFFQKIPKNCPAIGGFASRPPFGIRLSYTTLLDVPPRVWHFSHFTLGLSSLPVAKFWLNVKRKTSASDLPVYEIFVPQKVPLLKISDVVIAYDLWFESPNQKSWLRLCGVAK